MPKTLKYLDMNLDYPIRELGPVPQLRVKDLTHFQQETWRQETYETHQKTECIFLRHWKDRRIDAMELMDYPLLSVYLKPLERILSELRGHYDFTDYSAIITNLKAGMSIPKHTDGGMIFNLGHRIHIPIKTNPQVIFHVGHRVINMKLDHAYEIGNVSHMHGVNNKSDEDRYHLIIDLFKNLNY